jgi:hypothetical protein
MVAQRLSIPRLTGLTAPNADVPPTPITQLQPAINEIDEMIVPPVAAVVP